MSFGQKLQDARIANNLTQEQLADLLGITRQSVSRWETDVVYPDLHKIVQLANILKVSTDYLLRNEEEKEIEEKVSPILSKLINKRVKINYSSEELMSNNDDKAEIIVLDVDLKNMKLSIVNSKKNTKEEKIIRLSEIESIIVEEE